MRLMESEVSAPSGWQSSGTTPDSLTLELVFAVKQQNVGSLMDEVLAVSSPDSPRYGKHLSNQEVHDLVAPVQADIDAVLAFLESHGVQGRKATPNGDMVAAHVPVRLAETMLSAKYEALHHESTNTTLHRTPSGYSLPAKLAAVVDFVSPTVHMSHNRQPVKPSWRFSSKQRSFSIASFTACKMPTHRR
jgi:tripeptidyl-peptidase-1